MSFIVLFVSLESQNTYEVKIRRTKLERLEGMARESKGCFQHRRPHFPVPIYMCVQRQRKAKQPINRPKTCFTSCVISERDHVVHGGPQLLGFLQLEPPVGNNLTPIFFLQTRNLPFAQQSYRSSFLSNSFKIPLCR